MITHYDLLGLNRGATADEIRGAYRRLASKHHPDKNPGRAHKHDVFIEIKLAYEVLIDPVRREAYDRTLGTGHFERKLDTIFGNGFSFELNPERSERK